MRVTKFFLMCAALIAVTPVFADEINDISIRGILIQCLDEPGQTDRSLASFEPNLKRLLRFESYKSAGQGAVKIAAPGSGGFSIGNGNRIEVEVLEVSGPTIRARVRWSGGGRDIMDTVLSLRRGAPAVLGRSPTESGGKVFAALVIAQ